MRSLLIFLLFFLCCPPAASSRSHLFATTVAPAPVLNTPAFRSIFGGSSGRVLKTDRCGQVRELEYIALPGTVFKILAEQRDGASTIYRVTTDEYTASAGVSLYVDGRFLKLHDVEPIPRSRILPSRAAVISALRAAIGSSYVWGGNVREGIPELAKLYFSTAGKGNIPHWTLTGLDCSGLLYYASRGWTPRNTSQLISYGRAVEVEGKRSEEIAAMLEPLDLIVWNGHVIIVIDRENTIESRLECGSIGRGGVVTASSLQRLAELMKTRRPADAWPDGRGAKDVFVVRRWYDR